MVEGLIQNAFKNIFIYLAASGPSYDTWDLQSHRGTQDLCLFLNEVARDLAVMAVGRTHGRRLHGPLGPEKEVESTNRPDEATTFSNPNFHSSWKTGMSSPEGRAAPMGGGASPGLDTCFPPGSWARDLRPRSEQLQKEGLE